MLGIPQGPFHGAGHDHPAICRPQGDASAGRGILKWHKSHGADGGQTKPSGGVKKRFHQVHGIGVSNRSGQPKAWASLLEDKHEAGKGRVRTMGRSGAMSSFLNPDFPEARRWFRLLLSSIKLLCSLL
jgi:hypothetical protein